MEVKNVQNENLEDEKPVITLKTNENKILKFEIIDLITLGENEAYFITNELENVKEKSDEDEVTILKINNRNGEQTYDTVTDKCLAERIFEVFLERRNEKE